MHLGGEGDILLLSFGKTVPTWMLHLLRLRIKDDTNRLIQFDGCGRFQIIHGLITQLQ